mmetsp:Transcript_18531/g.34610  ORF Transcript_18531/g.34610 Transcript_18531/m.34610 type:complete len:670 (+) Transcript_18531:72-2081(+)
MNDALDIFAKGDHRSFLSIVGNDDDTLDEELLFAKGVSLLHTKQFSSASRVFLENEFFGHQEEASVVKASSVRCWLSSSLDDATRMLNDQNYESSLDIYEKMPLEDPTNDNADVMYQKLNNQALCLFKLKRYDESLSLLSGTEMKSAVKGKSDSYLKEAENEYNKGINYKKLKQFNESIRCFEESQRNLDLRREQTEELIATPTPWLSQLLVEAVDSMLQVGQFDTAIEAVTKALSEGDGVKLSPMTSWLLLFRAAAFSQMNRFDDAVSDLNSASSQATPAMLPDVCQLRVYCSEKKGIHYFNEEDFQKAAESYENALHELSELGNSVGDVSSIASLRVRILYNLSITHMKLENFDIAEQKFTYLIQLLSASPGNGSESFLVPAYAHLSQILMTRATAMPDDDDESIHKKTLEDNDDTQSTTSSHDEPNLTKLETFALAVDALKRASALQPSNLSIAYSLGVAQVRANLVTDAHATFSAILVKEPTHADALKAAEMCVSYTEALEAEKQQKAKEEAEAKAKEEAEAKAKEEANVKKKPVAAPVSTSSRASFLKATSPATTSYKKTYGNQSQSLSQSGAGSTGASTKVADTPPPASPAQGVPSLSSPSGGVFHPYESLKSPGPYPAGVTTDREQYLSDEDFARVFNVSKEEFAKFPGWKKISKRKATGLF